LLGPNPSKEFFLCHNRAWPFDKRREDFERAAPQSNGLFPLQQQPFVAKQAERRKRKLSARRWFGLGHSSDPSRPLHATWEK
jgi:hypothetical protein